MQDEFMGISTLSAAISLLNGTIILLLLRSSCNSIAVPLGTAYDEHNEFFLLETRFGVEVGEPSSTVHDQGHLKFGCSFVLMNILKHETFFRLTIQVESGAFTHFGCGDTTCFPVHN